MSEPNGGLTNGKTACNSCMGAAMVNFKAIFEAAAACERYVSPTSLGCSVKRRKTLICLAFLGLLGCN
tara:strand:+ start:252 stop:455 length:204 start_codon:yes stop_codon:yes gene_type:complete